MLKNNDGIKVVSRIIMIYMKDIVKALYKNDSVSKVEIENWLLIRLHGVV